MTWEVEYTDQFEEWWTTLAADVQEAIDASVQVLQEQGPALRRPVVGNIEGSRHANMKELIPPSGNIRILFAFDTHQTAILLLGGDKTGRWDAWYLVNIPTADQLYDDHLAEIGRERG